MSRNRCATLARLGVVLVALSLAASPARAAWTDCKRACAATGIQFQQAACTDGAGGVIVTWVDLRSDPGDIYVQRMDAGGNPLWTSNGVVVCNAAGVQATPAICPDGFGGALIAWTDARTGTADIYASKVTAAGAVSGAWPANGLRITNSSQGEFGPLITATGLGDAYLAWSVPFSTGDDDVYCSRVSASGTISGGWPANGLNLCSQLGNQRAYALVNDGSGSAYVIWEDARGTAVGGFDLYGAKVSSAGTLLAGWNAADGKLLCNAAGAQVLPVAVSDGAGGVLLAWQDARNGNPDVYAQRFASAGGAFWAANGVPVTTMPGSDVNLGIASDGSTGGAFVSWIHDAGADDHVYLQHLSPSGMPWAGFLPGGNAIAVSAGFKTDQALVADGLHGAMLAWMDRRDGTTQLYAQHVSGIGRMAYRANGQPTICVNADAGAPSLVGDGANGAIVAWSDAQFGTLDVFGLRFTGNNVSSFDALINYDYPIVPRNVASGTGHVTSVLDGNAPTTHATFSVHQQGPYPVPFLVAEHRLDEEQLLATTVEPDGFAPGFVTLDTGSQGFTVRGGRHQLSTWVDPVDLIYESDESDNDGTFQFVWSPLTVARATGIARNVPPDGGFLFPNPNGDGFQFTRNSSNAWVVAEAPMVAGDDDDLLVYSDYVGSTSGFSTMIGASVLGGTNTDFVVGHYSGTPVTVFPAVTRFDASAAASFAFDATDSQGREGSLANFNAWTNQVLPPNRLADVYEAYLEQDQKYQFVLTRQSGASDLAFAVFPATPGGIFSLFDAVESSGPASAVTDTAYYVADVTGWYPIVVYRTIGTQANGSLTYSFDWTRITPTTDAPPTDVPAVLALSSPWPNPTAGRTTVELALPRAGRVELALYDLAGRRVRRITDRELSAGRHTLTWDGVGERGERAAAGLYWLRLAVEGRVLGRRIAVLP